MPHVSFDRISLHCTYSRNTLAEIWGYSGFQALARGVVTPANDNKIILFVTGQKRDGDEQYDDSLIGGFLHWDGPNDHYAEQRMIDAEKSGDEIFLFYREHHQTDFMYRGRLKVQTAMQHTDRPSRFTFTLC